MGDRTEMHSPLPTSSLPPSLPTLRGVARQSTRRHALFGNRPAARYLNMATSESGFRGACSGDDVYIVNFRENSFKINYIYHMKFGNFKT